MIVLVLFMFRDVNGCCVGYFWNFIVDKCEGR